MALAVVALPLACVALIAGPASASTPTATGSLDCAVGGTVTFSPPLSFNGVAGSKESVTFGLTVSGGTSSDSNPAPAPTSATTKTKPVKLKGVKCQATAPTSANYNAACTSKGKPTMTGSCSGFSSQLSTIVLRSTEKWNTKIKPTKGTISDLHQNLSQYPPYIGSTGSGTSTGSYAGPVSTSTFYTAVSSAALLACEGGSELPVSTLNIDSAMSTISRG